jgi:sugar O-acyltransferase (sialic acid O-acetyltransferase NeuD family)
MHGGTKKSSRMSMRPLIVWGGTGHAKVLKELVQGTDLELVALVDNREIPSAISGVPILRGVAGLDAWLVGRHIRAVGAVAVGGGKGRDRVELMDVLLSRGIACETLRHRTAFVAEDAKIGEGCQILAHASICASVTLGRGVIANTAASVDHDCILGDGVHLAPGARLAGEIIVDRYAFIGIGAIILPGLKIGEGAVIGAGAVVTKNVPPSMVVIGNPAEYKRRTS